MEPYGHSGTFPNSLKLSEPNWNCQNHLEQSVTFSNSFELFRTIWNHLELF